MVLRVGKRGRPKKVEKNVKIERLRFLVAFGISRFDGVMEVKGNLWQQPESLPGNAFVGGSWSVMAGTLHVGRGANDGPGECSSLAPVTTRCMIQYITPSYTSHRLERGDKNSIRGSSSILY